eukprot:366871-Hanusia_phi.AAC.2
MLTFDDDDVDMALRLCAPMLSSAFLTGLALAITRSLNFNNNCFQLLQIHCQLAVVKSLPSSTLKM